MARLLSKLSLVVAGTLLAALVGTAAPAEARAGIHYVQVGDAQGTEAGDTPVVRFTINFFADPPFPDRDENVKVNYETRSATATEGVDYTKTKSSVTIAPNQNSATVDVPVLPDAFAEADEQFAFVITSVTQASVYDGEAVGTIINDDGAPPTLSIDDVTVPEGSGGPTPAVFTVTLAGPAAQQSVWVNYETKDGSAVAPTDYTAEEGELRFDIGQTTKIIEVNVNGDLTTENDETFTVELSLPRNAAVTKGTGNGTIQSDDLPKAQITTAPGRSGGPHVRIFDPNGVGNNGFLAYEAGFTGGIRVARGDFIGDDGVQEIVTAPCCFNPDARGTASRPLVRVFNQQGSLLTAFFAYHADFIGGVSLAVGNVDPRENAPGDELITGAGPTGGPHVRVWRIGSEPDPNNGLLPVFEITDAGFMAYDPRFGGGVNVAVGDVVPEPANDPGGERLEIVTAPMSGGGPHVQVIGIAVQNNQPRPYAIPWMAYDPAFRGGLNVAAGELDGTPGEEVITTPATPGGGPHVRSWDVAPNGTVAGRGPGFMAYDPAFLGGINVSSGNINSSAVEEIITGPGFGGGPHVRLFDSNGGAIGPGFMAYDPRFGGGVWVAFGGGE